jgi:MFS family permease
VAVIFAALLGVALTAELSPARMDAVGWRIPLFVGCAIVPLLFVIRRSLEETPEFLARARTRSIGEVLRTLGANLRLVLIGVMAVTMTTVSFYSITAYTPTFGREVLHLTSLASLAVTLCVGLSNLFWLPVMGALSDRVGRRPLLVGCTVLALVTAYPAMAWLVSAPSFGRLLAVELWLSFLYGSYNGAMVVALTEVMPVEVRTAGFSLAYSLATTIGGFTPAISMALIHSTGNKAAPGIWLSLAAICGLIATFVLYRKPHARVLQQQPA